MVCKENVVSWFGNLSSYKRIDVMCTLLNMCLPFEIRYLGTCIEDIGKRDYADLRETEDHANSTNELAELANLGIGDKRTRRKLALYMALLRSCNYSCAIIFHKILANLDTQEIINILNGAAFAPDDQPMEELLLLYTMALNHPAFTYEQKSTFGNIYVKLQEEESRLNLPKNPAAVNSSYKSSQGCGPCGNPSDRPVSVDPSVEMPVNCSMPPPPIQTYHGEMGGMRGNPMVSGVPPGLSLPPPGLCLPGHDQMTMGTTPAGTQYVHLGFPTVNHMAPWTGQVMMGNPLMYHTNDMLACPPSPLVSRQSSPSHSRSPSRSNSPLGRRSNNPMPRTSSQVIQSTCNTLTTSTGSSNNQSSITSTSATPHHQPPPSSIGCTTRSLPGGPPPMLPPRSAPPPITTTNLSYSRHNSIDNTSTVAASATKQPPPPPRLRATASGGDSSQRDNTAKDVNNFKGNLPNTSFGEIRRMSDEDVRDMEMMALGQLRNIVRSQTTNGLSQLGIDKKLENTNNVTHPVNEPIGSEEQLSQQQTLQQQQQQQSMQHHPPHTHINAVNLRRFPHMSALEHSQMQMYSPPPMYPPNVHCYSCIGVPVTGLPTRHSRCNAQHLYCTQLQALSLDPENSRHCSQSSSSESTGSRSPPETPPAVPWVSSSGSETAQSSTTEHQASPGTSSHHSTMSQSHQGAQSMSHMSERPRNQSKKHQSHVMRQKNQMVNGVTSGGNGNNCSGGNNGGIPNIPHCVSFPGPPTPSPVTFLPHAHFSPLRPSNAIYSNFSHAAYNRPPTFPTSYQPNGEMMYQYAGPGGTPPPPPPTVAAAPPHTYMPSAPVVTYTPAAPPAKISCYNCGSNNHVAADCKDQTMEELTKRATYRLDYTLMKQSGECPSSDK
ncbi:verprolin [Venturia canescens]|uniref:verprolin n=1 Tax=Venturia canescens TaxID=32260 RepID=UPI001C9C37F5|nr:verprolin [Venturia canescens]